MILEVKACTKLEWAQISDQAHLATFGEFRPKNFERIDFTLLVHAPELKKPVVYVTCAEVNSELLRWSFGGAFPEFRNTLHVKRAHQLGIDFCREKGWLHLVTLVKNDNAAALKLHMSAGFKVIGVSNFAGDVLVELHKDLREDF